PRRRASPPGIGAERVACLPTTAWGGRGLVAHPAFKAGRAVQPTAWKVRFLRRLAEPQPGSCFGLTMPTTVPSPRSSPDHGGGAAIVASAAVGNFAPRRARAAPAP